MKHNRIIMLLMLIVGTALLAGGMAGMYSLYRAAGEYGRATGVVLDVRTTRIYRGRKPRYESEMRISYSTPRYGRLVASVKNHNPFRRVGDELSVWYHPDRPRDILLPASDCAVWGILAVSGLVCLCGGLAVRKQRKNERQ